MTERNSNWNTVIDREKQQFGTQLLTERNSNLNTVIDREKQQFGHSY